MVDNQKVPNDGAAGQTRRGRRGECCDYATADSSQSRPPSCSSALTLPATMRGMRGMRNLKVGWDCLQALSTLAWMLTAGATLASSGIAYALNLPLPIILVVHAFVVSSLSGAMAWRQSRSHPPLLEDVPQIDHMAAHLCTLRPEPTPRRQGEGHHLLLLTWTQADMRACSCLMCKRVPWRG